MHLQRISHYIIALSPLFLAEALTLKLGVKESVYILILVATKSLTTLYQLCDIRKPTETQKGLDICIRKWGALSSTTGKDEKK